MIREKDLSKEHLNQDQLRALTPDITIPLDTQQSRLIFKSVPGMNKYLEKQYKAMVKKEEQKLAMDNLGKLKTQKKSIKQIIKPDYAYYEGPNEQVGQLHGDKGEYGDELDSKNF